MAKRWENNGNSDGLYFLNSKINADSYCSHEIKRCLLLGRKAMTNLNSILKSTVITLLAKVHIVKAMVFPLVLYACESWTVNEGECQRIDAFEQWCWRRMLRIPCTARSNQLILRKINPEYSLEGLMLKLQHFGHLFWRPGSLEKTLMLGKIEGRGEGDDRGWDGWMASLTRSRWVRANCRRGWGTGKPGMAPYVHGDHRQLDMTEWLNEK